MLGVNNTYSRKGGRRPTWMKKELLKDLRHHMKAQVRWKKDMDTKEK